MRDAGIIGFVPRGEYSPAETYNFLQFVYYNGSTYVAKKETTGNVPVENNEFWQILAKGEVQAVTGVKGDSEEKYRQGDVNLTAENIGALPVNGGAIAANTNPLLLLDRKDGNFSGLEFKNQNGHLFTIEGYSESGGTAKQLNIFARDIGKSLLRINETNRVIYDHKTKSEKVILVEGEALPITGGTLTQKAKYGSTLKLTNENENSDISLDLIPTNCPTRIRLQTNSRVNEAVFEIYDVEDGVKSTELFSVSRAGRRIIYDKKTNSMKQILIEGEALPVTGGQIDSPKFDPLVIRRTEDNPVGIRLVNLKGPLLNIQSSLDGDLPVFSVFDARNDMYLIQISKKVRKIYDYKTGEMKQIAIEDDVKYKAGDTVKIIANNMFSGCLTTSGTEIYFTIPLEKSAAGLQATIAGWIRVRGIDGYLINSENVADYDVSCFSRQNIVNNLLSFRVRKNDKSAFSAKNNFPVAVDGDFTITFS